MIHIHEFPRKLQHCPVFLEIVKPGERCSFVGCNTTKTTRHHICIEIKYRVSKTYYCTCPQHPDKAVYGVTYFDASADLSTACRFCRTDHMYK